MRLAIATVELANFLSFGPSPTFLDIRDLGPALVVGDNGAGKSNFLESIVWCLFGRTIHDPKPGDKILNWYEEKNCYVEIKTVDDWIIRRTRKMQSSDDLIVYHAESDETRSTNTEAQKFLNESFGLDFDIFCSSVFFGQKGKSFLRMTDTKRKAALERILCLDKLNAWADIARTKVSELETDQIRVMTQLTSLEIDQERVDGLIEENKKKSKEFQLGLEDRVDKIECEICLIEKHLEEMEIPDKEELETKWEIVHKIKTEIEKLESEARTLRSELDGDRKELADLQDEIFEFQKGMMDFDLEDLRKKHELADEYDKIRFALEEKLSDLKLDLRTLRSDKEREEELVNKWEELSGKVCVTCEQPIDSARAAEIVEASRANLEQISSRVEDLLHVRIGVEEKCDKIKAVGDPRPPVTVDQAAGILDDQDLQSQCILGQNTRYRELKTEAIPTKEARLQTVNDLILTTRPILDKKKPDMTMADFNDLVRRRDSCIKSIKDRTANAHAILEESDPYKSAIKGWKEQRVENENRIVALREKVSELDKRVLHLIYLRKAYFDRNKIKRLLLADLIPYLNERMAHYLRLFKSSHEIKFTDSLSVDSSRWSYNYCSGGEQKRIDISMMLALYDLLIALYGQQCNILILDEADGHLDSEGVHTFVDVIMNNFFNETYGSGQLESILVTSHKTEMVDSFPAKVEVAQKNGYSTLAI